MAASSMQQRSVAYAAILLGGVAAALLLGKDFSWDALAYHVYAGYSAVENRLAADYFAASTQGYLNPYAHVPFYLMLKHGFAPQLVVAVLALIHVLNLLIVYELACLLNRRDNGEVAWMPVVLAVLLAFLNPIFILELGNSFNEISTSVPLLLGCYLLLRGFALPRMATVALAGMLIGAAAALKLSNLLFTVSVLPLLLMAPASIKLRAQAVLAFAAGGMLGAIAAGGWWAWQLWELFGNPFFPLFNDIFKSPDVMASSVKHYRFLPHSLADGLLRPFMMLLPKGGVHVESVAPDLRYAALVLLLCLFGLKWAVRAAQLKLRQGEPFAPFQGQRALLALSLSLLCAWGLWLLASGNSRYFLSMSCLAAVVLASLLVRFSRNIRFFAYGGAAMLAFQAWTTVVVADHRWNPAQYGNSWFELTIPEQLRQQPQLYLHVGVLPASFLLPFLPEGSSMINLGGQYPLVDNAKIRALLDKHGANVRVMRRAPSDVVPNTDDFGYALLPFGLEADLDSCVNIDFIQRRTPQGEESHFYYASCKIRPLRWSAARLAEYAVKKRRFDAVSERLELLCPRYFQPRGVRSEGDGEKFWKVYVSTDIILRQFPDGKVDFRNELTHQAGVIGNIETLAHALPDKSRICP
jgi:hypothetical protein